MLDRDSQPLFPRLREFAYVPPPWGRNVIISEMAFVISLTGLSNIAIPSPTSRTGRNNFPKSLPIRHDPPVLQGLYLNTNICGDLSVQLRTNQVILSNPAQWKSLTHLRIQASLQPDTLMNIGAMPALMNLHILLLPGSVPEAASNHDLFHSLRTLTIEIFETLLPAAQFLHQFDPPIAYLAIDAPSLWLPHNTMEHLDQIGTGLLSPRIRSFLKKFKFSIERWFNPVTRVDDPYHTIFMTSLLSLSRLDSVEIDVNFGGYFGDLDTAIAHMALTWHHLTNLRLYTGPRRATLKKLLLLSTHCPYLTTLTLPVDLSGDVPDVSAASANEKLNLEPITLNFPIFQDAPIFRPKMIKITKFLISIFPNLKFIVAPCFPIDDNPWFQEDGNPWDRALQHLRESI
jgi:hypothetical protein